MKIEIGIPETQRQEIVAGLKRLLADSYSLYLKTHNFHWNVTGPMFMTLHTLFETNYTELALAVDAVAERIRSLGAIAPGSYSEFGQLSSIRDSHGDLAAEKMLEILVADNEAVIRTARSVFAAAEAGNDEATADLLTQRLQVHEKAAWMLRSLLEKRG